MLKIHLLVSRWEILRERSRGDIGAWRSRREMTDLIVGALVVVWRILADGEGGRDVC